MHTGCSIVLIFSNRSVRLLVKLFASANCVLTKVCNDLPNVALLQQHLLQDPNQTNGLHDSLHGLQHTSEFQPGMVMMASSNRTNNTATQGSFVRTGANRFTRKKSPQVAQPQQTVATVSSVATSQASNVPEQLQTQVQIRDILPIQVSVKSSEYIEAKIRTLRKNNNFE